jgi:hypothetical protein
MQVVLSLERVVVEPLQVPVQPQPLGQLVPEATCEHVPSQLGVVLLQAPLAAVVDSHIAPVPVQVAVTLPLVVHDRPVAPVDTVAVVLQVPWQFALQEVLSLYRGVDVTQLPVHE